MNLGSRFFGNIIRRFLRVPSAHRQALPARAGLGGQNHQTLNPLLGLNPQQRDECPHLSGARNVSRLLPIAENSISKHSDLYHLIHATSRLDKSNQFCLLAEFHVQNNL